VRLRIATQVFCTQCYH